MVAFPIRSCIHTLQADILLCYAFAPLAREVFENTIFHIRNHELKNVPFVTSAVTKNMAPPTLSTKWVGAYNTASVIPNMQSDPTRIKSVEVQHGSE